MLAIADLFQMTPTDNRYFIGLLFCTLAALPAVQRIFHYSRAWKNHRSLSRKARWVLALFTSLVVLSFSEVQRGTDHPTISLGLPNSVWHIGFSSAWIVTSGLILSLPAKSESQRPDPAGKHFYIDHE